MIKNKTNIYNLKEYIKSEQAIAETFCVYAILRNVDWRKGFHNIEEYIQKYNINRGLSVGTYTWEFLILNEYKRLVNIKVLIEDVDFGIIEFQNLLNTALKGVE